MDGSSFPRLASSSVRIRAGHVRISAAFAPLTVRPVGIYAQFRTAGASAVARLLAK